jgi:hypothetical protein
MINNDENKYCKRGKRENKVKRDEESAGFLITSSM